jgi:hypothetical protein
MKYLTTLFLVLVTFIFGNNAWAGCPAAYGTICYTRCGMVDTTWVCTVATATAPSDVTVVAGYPTPGTGYDAWGHFESEPFCCHAVDNGIDEIEVVGSGYSDHLNFHAVVGGTNYNLYGISANIKGTIYGDNGIDVIRGSDSTSVLYEEYLWGEGDEDIIHGGNGKDYIYGGDCDDSLYGESGDDYMVGGEGNDNMDGGDGGDTMFGEEIWGGIGYNDTMLGNNGADIMHGGAGDDDMRGSPGSDEMYGEEGDDVLDGGQDDDYLNGGADDDVLCGGPELEEGDELDDGDIDPGVDVLWGNTKPLDEEICGNETTQWYEVDTYHGCDHDSIITTKPDQCPYP